MALPDATRLHDLPPDAWRRLGHHLKAIGYTGATSLPIRQLVPVGTSPAHTPMAKWHARRVAKPWGAALRMFLLGDPVTDEEARAALGDAPGLERLLEVGLLAHTAEGTIASSFVLHPAGDALFFCEEPSAGGEAVMGPGGTTLHLMRAAYPPGRMRTALDVGCGAGTAAILLAKRFDRVVATDLSARAIDLARVNGALNNVDNVDFRVGDLFGPVAEETFDLIVSQPPFIARPDDSPATTFLFGGARGDELPMRLMREVEAHLAPGGMAIAVIEWPVAEGDLPLEERLREAVVSADSSLLLIAGRASIDEHCTRYATLMHPTLDEAWERIALRHRDHFDKLRMREIRPSFTIVRRSTDGSVGWTMTEESLRFGKAWVTHAKLEAMAVAFDLAQRGTEALRAARLRVPDEVSFSEHGGRFQASYGEHGWRGTMGVDETTFRLVHEVNRAETVGEVVERLARGAEVPSDAEATALDHVQGALLHGLLEVDQPD
jgi:SAM-dependent methyltransferase